VSDEAKRRAREAVRAIDRYWGGGVNPQCVFISVGRNYVLTICVDVRLCFV